MNMKKISYLLLFFLFSTSLFAKTEDFKLFGYGDTFQLNLTTESILLGTSISLVGTYFNLDKAVSIKDTNWDGQLFNKDEVNSLDKIFMNPYSSNLHMIANGTVLLSLISPLVFVSTSKNQWINIGTMYTEAFLMSYGIKELAKTFVHRARPYMYYEGYPEEKVTEGDWCKSWPSGHTTNAFLGASFTSYVFCKYFPDSSWRYAVIGGTYALATTTAILRMASGNHFLTDVISGAIIGTTCGFAIPMLHNVRSKYKEPKIGNCSVDVSPLGVGFSLKL